MRKRVVLGVTLLAASVWFLQAAVAPQLEDAAFDLEDTEVRVAPRSKPLPLVDSHAVTQRRTQQHARRQMQNAPRRADSSTLSYDPLRDTRRKTRVVVRVTRNAITLEDANVTLWEMGDATNSFFTWGKTDNRGRITFEAVPAARYRLRVGLGDQSHPFEFDVRPDRKTTVFHAAVRPATLRVRIAGEIGEFSTTWIELVQLDGDVRATRAVIGPSETLIENLLGGRYRLTVRKNAEYTCDPSVVRLAPGAYGHATLQVWMKAWITFDVRGHSGVCVIRARRDTTETTGRRQRFWQRPFRMRLGDGVWFVDARDPRNSMRFGPTRRIVVRRSAPQHVELEKLEMR